MAITTYPLTYDDLANLPDDGRRYELIDGELFVTPAPIPAHQRVSTRFTAWMYDFVTPRGLGEVFAAPCDVKLSERDVVEPDIVFVSRERRGIIGPTCITGAPDLVVEILSPSTRHVDEGRKAETYAAFGIREYWLADYQARELRVLALNAQGRYEPVPQAGGVARSVVLPGFAVDVAALFADLD